MAQTIFLSHMHCSLRKNIFSRSCVARHDLLRIYSRVLICIIIDLRTTLAHPSGDSAALQESPWRLLLYCYLRPKLRAVIGRPHVQYVASYQPLGAFAGLWKSMRRPVPATGSDDLADYHRGWRTARGPIPSGDGLVVSLYRQAQFRGCLTSRHGGQ